MRDRAMTVHMYGGDLCVSKIINMDYGHFDTYIGEIWVLGKTSKDRTTLIGASAVIWQQHWFSLRNSFTLQNDTVFISSCGNRIYGHYMQKKCTFYQYKRHHSFTTYLLEPNGNIRAVRKLPGSSNLATTPIYTYFDFQHLSCLCDAAYPCVERTKYK